jgi:DNA-binding transcriptional regulator YdaS (Cro superfamily)
MDTRTIITLAGGPSRVARAIGVHHSSVVKWTRVPPLRARAVARLAGLQPHDVRPDIYPPPDAPALAEAAQAA